MQNIKLFSGFLIVVQVAAHAFSSFVSYGSLDDFVGAHLGTDFTFIASCLTLLILEGGVFVIPIFIEKPDPKGTKEERQKQHFVMVYSIVLYFLFIIACGILTTVGSGQNAAERHQPILAPSKGDRILMLEKRLEQQVKQGKALAVLKGNRQNNYLNESERATESSIQLATDRIIETLNQAYQDLDAKKESIVNINKTQKQEVNEKHTRFGFLIQFLLMFISLGRTLIKDSPEAEEKNPPKKSKKKSVSHRETFKETPKETGRETEGKQKETPKETQGNTGKQDPYKISTGVHNDIVTMTLNGIDAVKISEKLNIGRSAITKARQEEFKRTKEEDKDWTKSKADEAAVMLQLSKIPE